MERVPTLLPLRAHPLARPHAWDILRAHGPAVTVAVDVARGPGNGRDLSYTAAIRRLAAARVGLLGYVDLAYATRPVPEILADVDRWAGYPVHGIFFDRAPGSPYAIGPVAIAIQAARRATLEKVVLNPGIPPDPDLDQAARLQIERGAGFGVVTDLGPPDPFADLPAWCGGITPGAGAAGTWDTRTTTGS